MSSRAQADGYFTDRADAMAARFVKAFFCGAPSCSNEYNLASIDNTGGALSVRKRVNAAMTVYRDWFGGQLSMPDNIEDE